MAERCAAVGCGRFVREGTRWCGRHLTARGADDADAPGGEEAREEPARRAEFRRRLAAGEYRALFGEGMAEALRQAGNDAELGDEIGALRITLARLLVEEEDLGRLATNVARVAGVAIQAARAQATIRRQAREQEGDEWSLEAMLARLAAEEEV